MLGCTRPLEDLQFEYFLVNPSIRELSVQKTYPFVDLIPIYSRSWQLLTILWDEPVHYFQITPWGEPIHLWTK